ncbi:MAG: hypothetical protein PVJ84_03585 [Desulfobacteraceae bacterium]|jgi:hypothetical protein
MRLFTSAIVLVMLLSLLACGAGDSSDTGTSGETSGEYTSSLELTTSEYAELTALERYAVINKLMSALYKGTAASDFFDLSSGLEPLMINSAAMDIGEVKSALQKPMDDKNAVLDLIDDKYYFDERARPLQYPLAMLYEFPLSRDYFAVWMAYRLTNSILFSPALELETCNYTDIQRVFQRLFSMIENGDSIRDVVYAHMISQENWRRFRSPEDNTREMMEIFLGRFKDEEVPLASLACKNWSLTDDSDDYQLVIGYDENTQPQAILDTTVTTCTDFYMAIANHADLIPRIASVLVEDFLSGASDDEKQQVVDVILSENPHVFEDIFIPIIFSREFLLDTERPAQFEERFFNIAHRISWWAKAKFFKEINPAWSGSSYPSLKNMKQAAATYKLGRPAEVPLDTLSFSFFHKAIREKLLLDIRKDVFEENDGGWQDEFIQVDLSNDDFIKYLFISIISRLPTDIELTTLGQIFEDRGYTTQDRALYQALIVMDYLSRLSETYYLNALD